MDAKGTMADQVKMVVDLVARADLEVDLADRADLAAEVDRADLAADKEPAVVEVDQEAADKVDREAADKVDLAAAEVETTAQEAVKGLEAVEVAQPAAVWAPVVAREELAARRAQLQKWFHGKLICSVP